MEREGGRQKNLNYIGRLVDLKEESKSRQSLGREEAIKENKSCLLSRSRWLKENSSLLTLFLVSGQRKMT